MNKRSQQSSHLFLSGKNKRGFLNWKWIVIPLGILIILGAVLYFMFFHYKNCNDWECFNDNLEKCNRVKFIGGTKMVFEYKVNGIEGGECEVYARLLQGELDNQDSIKLEGQDMICSLPKGVVMIPESDITNCHGLLKEGLQELIINKLYSYLVQNIGQINLEVVDIDSI